MNARRIDRRIIVLVLGVIGLSIGWIVFQRMQFRVVAVVPNARKSIATSSTMIKIDFNRDLDSSKLSMDQISGTDIVKEYKVDGSSLMLYLKTLGENKPYEILITDITSVSGEVISKTRFSFKAVYVEPSNLSDKELDQQIKSTDPDDAIGSILPYEGSVYYIDYINRNDQKPLISIEMNFRSEDKTNPKYLALVEKYRTEAFDYLKSHGVDIDAYEYIYSEPVLLDKFPKGTYYADETEGDQ